MRKDQYETAQDIQEEINYLKEYSINSAERSHSIPVVYRLTLPTRLESAKQFQEEVDALHQKYKEGILSALERRVRVLKKEFAELSCTAETIESFWKDCR